MVPLGKLSTSSQTSFFFFAKGTAALFSSRRAVCVDAGSSLVWSFGKIVGQPVGTVGGPPPGFWEWILKPCLCSFYSLSPHQQSRGCIHNIAAFKKKEKLNFVLSNFTDKPWVLLLGWILNHNLVKVRMAVNLVRLSKGKERRKQKGETCTASRICLAIFFLYPPLCLSFLLNT